MTQHGPNLDSDAKVPPFNRIGLIPMTRDLLASLESAPRFTAESGLRITSDQADQIRGAVIRRSISTLGSRPSNPGSVISRSMRAAKSSWEVAASREIRRPRRGWKSPTSPFPSSKGGDSRPTPPGNWSRSPAATQMLRRFSLTPFPSPMPPAESSRRPASRSSGRSSIPRMVVCGVGSWSSVEPNSEAW